VRSIHKRTRADILPVLFRASSSVVQILTPYFAQKFLQSSTSIHQHLTIFNVFSLAFECMSWPFLFCLVLYPLYVCTLPWLPCSFSSKVLHLIKNSTSKHILHYIHLFFLIFFFYQNVTVKCTFPICSIVITLWLLF